MIPTTHSDYQRFTFQGQTGYVLAPWLPGVNNEWVSIRHSAAVHPWTDSDIHFHCESEEYYFLLQGQIQLLVGDLVVSLRPGEILSVKPLIPHAVIGGEGPIEHFVLRMPAHDDRQRIAVSSTKFSPQNDGAKRDLQGPWGVRVPLTDKRYQNCWLFGTGQARFHSDQICLAYLNFPTSESAAAGMRNHPHRLHLHHSSWEVYTLLKGKKMLQIEDQLVEVNAGELLVIPPGIKHVLERMVTPCEAFTFRVPLQNDKVEI